METWTETNVAASRKLGNSSVSTPATFRYQHRVDGPCILEDDACRLRRASEEVIANPFAMRILQELIPFVFTPHEPLMASENVDINDTHTTSKPAEVPPEQLVTWLELKRSLLFCGVKRHRCSEALKSLWRALLTLCCDPSHRVFGEGKVVGRADNNRDKVDCCGVRTNATEFAVLVRHEAFRSVAQSVIHHGSLNGFTVVGESVVPLEELLSHFIGLHSWATSQMNANLGARCPAHKYVLVVHANIFGRCITKVLTQELRGEHITLTPLLRWSGAQAVVQQRRALVVFCGGTSGCGKSTLSSLITTHLSIPVTLSTDTIRQALRCTLRREEFPELFTSTYTAHLTSATGREGDKDPCGVGPCGEEADRLIAAYEKQCAAVLPVLDSTLEMFVRRNRAVVVEGAHLLPGYMHRKTVELQAQGVLCVSFLVCIRKREQHLERFCTRAKSMSLSPKRNKYVSNFDNIRLIQQHLLDQAKVFGMNIINNTNIDKSLMAVHTRLLDGVHDLRDMSELQRHLRSGETNSNERTDNTASFDPHYYDKKVNGVAQHRSLLHSDVGGKRLLALLLHRRNEKKHRMDNGPVLGCHYCDHAPCATQSRRSRSTGSLSTLELSTLQVWEAADGHVEKALLAPRSGSLGPQVSGAEYGCIRDAAAGSPSRDRVGLQSGVAGTNGAGFGDCHRSTLIPPVRWVRTETKQRVQSNQIPRTLLCFIPTSSSSVRSLSADTERADGRMCKRSRGWSAMALLSTSLLKGKRGGNKEGEDSPRGDNLSSETPSLTCC